MVDVSQYDTCQLAVPLATSCCQVVPEPQSSGEFCTVLSNRKLGKSNENESVLSNAFIVKFF